MARPIKEGCDYFQHDSDMRNHRKIKAIRTKYGPTGYAIWCMTLEYLTSAPGNTVICNTDEVELMAGDYGISATEIQDVLDYCVRLKLLSRENDQLYSIELINRLKPVYDKRKVNRGNAEQQSRSAGVFVTNNTDF